MIVLHGENLVESRKELQRLKDEAREKDWEVVVFDGRKVSLIELRQALESGNLFGAGRLVVIEDYRKEITDLVKDRESVVIWMGKKLTETAVKGLGGQGREFKVSPEIWRFLERPSLSSWAKVKHEEAVELIFFMLARQLRMLIQAKTSPELLKGHPFVTSKIKRQAQGLEVERLLEMHRLLYEIDKRQKTGATPLSLFDELELWIACWGQD